MAINYTTLFGDIKAFVSAYDVAESYAEDIETKRAAIQASLVTSGLHQLITGTNPVFYQFVDIARSQQSTITSMVRNRIVDETTVLNQLVQLTTNSFTEVTLGLIADMVENSESLDLNAVTVGTITATLTNSTAGSLIVSKKLPGNKSPAASMPTNKHLAGIDTEIPASDSIAAYCTDDRQTSTGLGGETFIVSGVPVDEFTTAGNTGQLQLTVGGSNEISNGNFTSFTTNVPTGWTLTSGVAGTDVLQEVTEYLTDTSSLEVDNDFELRYPINSIIEPGQILSVSLYLKKTGGATGTITVGSTINGGSAGSVAIDVSTLSSSAWTLKNFDLVVPDDIGSNTTATSYLSIVGATLSAVIWIDNLLVSEYEYFAGLGFIITIENDKFIEGNRFDFTVTNDGAGTLNRWMIENLKFQFPSDGSPTIAD